MDLIALIVPFLAAAVGALLSVLKITVPQKFFDETPVGQVIARVFNLKHRVQGPEALFQELSAASEKMDATVRQLQEYTKGREQAITKLESELGLLSQQEQELKQRIQGLKNVPLPAAEYFAQLVDRGEKRKATRDYVLFLLGVLVTTLIAVLLKRFGVG